MLNNSSTNNEITAILTIVLSIMMCILMLLVVVFIVLKVRDNKNKKQIITDINNKEKKEKKTKKQIQLQRPLTGLDKGSIMDFMEFEKVQDNMIIAKSRKKYLMVVECKGVNYDLMSQPEKVGVEEGFQQFLNTLRHPIQIYIQTRTINLGNSINRYKAAMKQIELDYRQKEEEYKRIRENVSSYGEEQLNRSFFELTRQRNLLEYGRDIIANTEKMSLNRSVLNKNFYVIVPYYVEEVGSDKYYEEELLSRAFSELYTKSQSIIRTLSSCSVTGRILNSRELIELLYVAYNRDDSEVLGLDKVLASGYEDLYSTGIDVFKKKSKLLDEEINRRAIKEANKAIQKVKSQVQKEVEEKENNIEQLAKKMAAVILENNKSRIGANVARRAKEEIEREEKENEQKGQENSTKQG